MWPAPLPEELKQRVVALLCRYFESLEGGTAEMLYPAPDHVWRWYRGEMTVERMRGALEALDEYLNAMPQHNWAESHASRPFDAGPDLSRLPTGAMLAMFQELDAVFAAQAAGAPA